MIVLLFRGARLDAVYVIGNGCIDFASGHGTIMRFTFVNEKFPTLFFLSQDHGVLRRHLDQHEPLTGPFRDDDLLAEAFLHNLDMQIIGRANQGGTGKEPDAQTRSPQQRADPTCDGPTGRHGEKIIAREQRAVNTRGGSVVGLSALRSRARMHGPWMTYSPRSSNGFPSM